jgi:hypothetical protein
MQPTIPSGRYRGFNKSQIIAARQQYIAEVQRSGSRLAGASQSGQSYQFGPRADWSLDEWNDELSSAEAYFGIGDEPEGDSVVIRFR